MVEEVKVEVEESASPVDDVKTVMEEADTQDTEVDRDSLVPGTGSINGDITEEVEDGEGEESDQGEDITEEEEEEMDDENMSAMVQGTTETILNKLEENLTNVPDIDESELLQAAEPGPLDPEVSSLFIYFSVLNFTRGIVTRIIMISTCPYFCLRSDNATMQKSNDALTSLRRLRSV